VERIASLPAREKLAWGIAAASLLLLLIARINPSVQSVRTSSGKPIVWSASEADRQISAAQDALKNNPEDLNALNAMAVGYFSKGQEFYVEGMNALERARALGSTNELLFYYAGVMYSALGLPDYAINDLKRYLRHHPKNYEARVRLANLYFHANQLDDAYEAYREALKEWPNDPTVLLNYSVTAVKKNDAESAEQALDQLQAREGKLPPGGLYQRGEIAKLKGDEKGAIAFYQQELAQNPDHLPSLEALESALRRQGDQKAARAIKTKINEVKKARG
jgi:tetratricopeptide (TPR) repeat protein